MDKRKEKTIKDLVKKAKENKKVIDAQLREKITRQKDYRQTVLTLEYQNSKIMDFLEEIKVSEKTKQLPVKFMGVEYGSTNTARCDYNLELFSLSSLIIKKNYLLQALQNDGLTKEDIANVLEGKYKKEFNDKTPKSKE